jgi:hypothetical protein
VYVWGAKDFPRQYGYTSFLGLGFFDGVHFVSSTESNGVQVTYCDDVACRNNCVVGSNLSPPLINPDYNTHDTPHSSPDDVYEVANNLPGTVTAPDGVPGGALALTGAYGNGILWASINSPFAQPQDSEAAYTLGSLFAFDAQTMKLLWSNIFETYGYVKYAPPTVTNDKVYLPGLQISTNPPPPPPGGMPPGPALDSEILVYGL